MNSSVVTGVVGYNLVSSVERRIPSHESLPSARQHPSYGDCLEVKREY